MPKMWEFISSRLDKEKKYNFGRDLHLDGVRSVHFYKSEWESFTAAPTRVSNKYLVYRLFYLCIVSGILFFSVGCSARPDQKDRSSPNINMYLVFLTHWSIITQCVYGLVFVIRLGIQKWKYRKETRARARGEAGDAAQGQDADAATLLEKATQHYPHTEECEVVVRVFQRGPGDPVIVDKLPVLDRTIWLLFSCTTVLPTVVTLGFWGFLYSPAQQAIQEEDSWCSFPTSVLVHGLNVFVFWIDFFVVAIPIRFAHFIYIGAYGFIYGSFTGFYELGGGYYTDPNEPYFYSFLNWRHTPGAALTALYLFMILGALIYGLTVLGYKLRLWLVSKYKPETKHEHEYKFQWMRKRVPICAPPTSSLSCWCCKKDKQN